MSDENFTDENLFDAAGAVNAGPGADDTEAEWSGGLQRG